MLIGYARTSTAEQEAGMEAQDRDLLAAGCERSFAERVSSVDKARRVQLAEAVAFARGGDVLVVTKLDRLARSVPDLLGIVDQLQAKGVGLRALASGELDTTSPTGRLMLTMLGAVAEFERGVMLERQREGIAKAKAEGKYRGRQPTARAKGEQVRQLLAEGLGATEIARRLGIGRASVYRVAGDAQGAAQAGPGALGERGEG